jgi:hypothetical protein
MRRLLPGILTSLPGRAAVNHDIGGVVNGLAFPRLDYREPPWRPLWPGRADRTVFAGSAALAPRPFGTDAVFPGHTGRTALAGWPDRPLLPFWPLNCFAFFTALSFFAGRPLRTRRSRFKQFRQIGENALAIDRLPRWALWPRRANNAFAGWPCRTNHAAQSFTAARRQDSDQIAVAINDE